MQAPSAVAEAWCAEFDTLYVEDRAFTLAMHPQIIGRGSRLLALEKLIEHIQAHPNVWFARMDEAAEAIRPALEQAADRAA
jgi:peptidoglycan/xylan/chitin deacetylase (PgdA/CDA1 family)